MLLLGGRAPPKILFAKDTGRVLQSDLMPVYNEKGMLERVEAVPFRLTRNMFTFFTAFGVEGVFVAALANAAQALLHKQVRACACARGVWVWVGALAALHNRAAAGLHGAG